MCKFLKTATLWLWGGFIYYMIELAWRGHSHPSMFVVGGLCFLIIGGINNWLTWTMGFIVQAVVGAVGVTVTELVSGLVINRLLGLAVWDYSGLKLNILGQVSLLYSFLWVPLAAAGIYIDDFLRWKLYGEERPQYVIF